MPTTMAAIQVTGISAATAQPAPARPRTTGAGAGCTGVGVTVGAPVPESFGHGSGRSSNGANRSCLVLAAATCAARSPYSSTVSRPVLMCSPSAVMADSRSASLTRMLDDSKSVTSPSWRNHDATADDRPLRTLTGKGVPAAGQLVPYSINQLMEKK